MHLMKNIEIIKQLMLRIINILLKKKQEMKVIKMNLKKIFMMILKNMIKKIIEFMKKLLIK
jgi:hypothetical protein